MMNFSSFKTWAFHKAKKNLNMQHLLYSLVKTDVGGPKWDDVNAMNLSSKLRSSISKEKQCDKQQNELIFLMGWINRSGSTDRRYHLSKLIWGRSLGPAVWRCWSDRCESLSWRAHIPNQAASCSSRQHSLLREPNTNTFNSAQIIYQAKVFACLQEDIMLDCRQHDIMTVRLSNCLFYVCLSGPSCYSRQQIKESWALLFDNWMSSAFVYHLVLQNAISEPYLMLSDLWDENRT